MKTFEEFLDEVSHTTALGYANKVLHKADGAPDTKKWDKRINKFLPKALSKIDMEPKAKWDRRIPKETPVFESMVGGTFSRKDVVNIVDPENPKILRAARYCRVDSEEALSKMPGGKKVSPTWKHKGEHMVKLISLRKGEVADLIWVKEVYPDICNGMGEKEIGKTKYLEKDLARLKDKLENATPEEKKQHFYSQLPDHIKKVEVEIMLSKRAHI
jgi:hypothetical protein